MGVADRHPRLCSGRRVVKLDSRTPVTKAFAARVRALRQGAGLGQAELADALGVSRKAVSAWERGRQVPPIDTLVALSDKFGFDLQDLKAAS